MGNFNTVQNKACRFFMAVQKTASNIATRGEMDWISIYNCQNWKWLDCGADYVICLRPGRLNMFINGLMTQNRMKNWEYFILKIYSMNDLDFLNVIQPITRFTPA